jgi:hypothetical protein
MHKKEKFNIFSHQRNINQNDIEISSHPSYNRLIPVNKPQILTRTVGDLWGKETLYTVGGNVNYCSPHGNQYKASSKKPQSRSDI